MLKSKKYTLVKSFSKNKGLKIINFVCRYVAYVLPQTFAVEAIRGILLRGWGLSYMPVYRGFLVTIAWIIVTFAAFKKIVMNQGQIDKTIVRKVFIQFMWLLCQSNAYRFIQAYFVFLYNFCSRLEIKRCKKIVNYMSCCLLTLILLHEMK